MSTLQVGIAVAQLNLPAARPVENRERIVGAIRAAVAKGANLVVLPELASSGYRLQGWEEAHAVAESIPGPTTKLWQEEARSGDCYIVGGICEREGNALYNTSVLVGPEGLLAVYRKLHLFGEERLMFMPGDAGLPVVTLPFGRVGLLTCYDLRFFEAARIVSLQGADLIAVTTAWTLGFDRALPPDGIIDQVRAAAVQSNVCQVFMAAASRVGTDGDLRYLGSSVIVDPYGRLVCGPMSRDHEGVEVANVDLADARRAKVRDPLITPLADRRTDVYADTLGYDRERWEQRQQELLARP
jgi:N-carbamoylputrescine amidase